MKTCEVKGCKEKLFATAYPDDLKFRLCAYHFKDKFGHLVANAPIVDMTGDDD